MKCRSSDCVRVGLGLCACCLVALMSRHCLTTEYTYVVSISSITLSFVLYTTLICLSSKLDNLVVIHTRLYCTENVGENVDVFELTCQE